MDIKPITFDNARAVSEGWDLFEMPAEGAPYAILRNDEDTEFADDAEAVAFVLNSAMDGSDYHRDALAVVLGLYVLAPDAIPAPASDDPAAYFPAHLRSEDESRQKWTVKVDKEADALFRTLSEADIRKRQDLCQQQGRQAFEQGKEAVALDIARQDEALMREMLRRC